jgi:hypothetical protein
MSTAESIPTLVQLFANSVVEQNSAIRADDLESGNRHARMYMGAFRKLRDASPDGLDALASLLDDPRCDVRTMAACYLLRHSTEKALKVLRGAIPEKGATGLGALMTLRRWEKWNLEHGRALIFDPIQGTYCSSACHLKTAPSEAASLLTPAPPVSYSAVSRAVAAGALRRWSVCLQR